jgi:hypothetical protein
MPTYRIIPETLEQVRDDIMKLELQRTQLVIEATLRNEKLDSIVERSGLTWTRIYDIQETIDRMELRG